MNLYSEIPDEYKMFGNFGEGVWDKMITEGLITSYPKDTVVKFLEKFHHQLFEIEVVPFSSDTNTIDIYVSTRTNQSLDLKSVKSILDSKLKVYGYFVGKVSRTDHFGGTKLLIEAKFPTILSPEDIHDSPFYHITSNIYLDKIKRIGLTPRDSTTIFTHPGNRIYLIQTHNKRALQFLKDQLSMSKVDRAQEIGLKNSEKWMSGNMITLQVNAEGLTLYSDPMFDKSNEYNAVFTQQNISPDRITVANL
jgi:hypothetical protein